MRGQGGVAILYDINLSQATKVLPDGSNCILAITISTVPPHDLDLCIVYVYLPSRGYHSETEYQDCLDQLATIHTKYRVSHKVILAGDFNASLLHTRHSRDTRLQRWCADHDFTLSRDYSAADTFSYSCAGRFGHSTIDYLIVSPCRAIGNTSIIRDMLGNTSPHYPVTCLITCLVQLSFDSEPDLAPRPEKSRQLIWSKCDHELLR